MTISFKGFVEELEETVKHDRFVRSHGKKAPNTYGKWHFTTKSSGDPSSDEKVSVSGKLSDAGKEAKKKLGAKHVYVMESVELDELTQREKEMIAKRKAARMKKGSKTGKATRAKPKKEPATKPEPKKTAGNTRDSSDRHIVMQLRKAQDVDGNYDIQVSPSKSIRLKKSQIDKLLSVHDKLQKPEDKRKYRIGLTKKLRSMR